MGMKISEIITDKYKLRIPPTVYYDLLADVQEVEEGQEPQTFKWCTDCKEYDQEKHCCHRWSRVIRDTVEEMKQEPILDKARTEIERGKTGLDIEFNGGIDYALSIIDKYKAENEPQESGDKE